MRKLQLLSFAAALAAAGSASAGELGKFYLKGEFGYNLSHGKVKLESQKYKDSDATAGNNSASAVDGTIVKGQSKNAANFDNASISGGFGYNVSDEFRTDLVFDYRFKQKQKFDFDAGAFLNPIDGSTSTALSKREVSRESWLLMMNFYYDFNNTSDWTPFVNAGLGYGSTKVKNLFTEAEDKNTKSKNAFAWGVGGGIAYKVSDGIYTDLSYKLTGMKAESENKDQAKIDKYPGSAFATVKVKTPDITHSINLGLRVEF